METEASWSPLFTYRASRSTPPWTHGVPRTNTRIHDTVRLNLKNGKIR